jgi:hemolysin-activating ACP:hemolysin acyltransferase
LETVRKPNIPHSYEAKGSPKAKYRKSGYSSDEVEELTHLSWAYMDSETEEQLMTNRTALVSALRASEKAYTLEI